MKNIHILHITNRNSRSFQLKYIPTCNIKLMSCLLLTFTMTFSPCPKAIIHCTLQSYRGGIHREQQRQKVEKRIYFGPRMYSRSKTWQSHDQRLVIILELHCSFNPSERTIFYREEEEGVCDDAAGGGNRRGMAVTSCWKGILLNVAGALKGVDGVDRIKLPCVSGAWGPQAPVHSALNSGLVLFFNVSPHPTPFARRAWGSWFVECDLTTVFCISHIETENSSKGWVKQSVYDC